MNDTHVEYADYQLYAIPSVAGMRPETFTRCPMCNGELTTRSVEHSRFWRDSGDAMPDPDGTELSTCAKCRWWGLRERGDNISSLSGWDTLASGIVRRWDLDSHDLPIDALISHFKNIRTIEFRVLDPTVFEKLVAECLKVEYGPCEVYHVGARGGAGDGGVDIYIVKGNEDWLIQVKRRISDRPEPITTIRELNGVLLREGKTRGMVVTSAPRYTQGAKDETNIQTVGPYCIKLLNSGHVFEMIERLPIIEKRSWEHALDSLSGYAGAHPELPDEYLRLFEKFTPLVELEGYRRELGVAIKSRREQFGLSQEALAEKVALHRDFIESVERGKLPVTIDGLTNIAKALGCGPSELLCDEGLEKVTYSAYY